MMLVNGYKTKKALRESVGKPLRFTETSLFGAEYSDDGSFVVAHRPLIQHAGGREFFAQVTMRGGLIHSVK